MSGRLGPALADERRPRPDRAAVRRGRRADRLERRRRSRVYDASSNTVYRATLPATRRTHATRHGAPPTLAEIDDFLADLGVHWAVSAAQPDGRRRAARLQRHRLARSTTAACSARSSSPGTPPHGMPLRAGDLRAGQLVARARARRRPTSRTAPVPTSDVDVSPPAGAKVVDLGSTATQVRPRNGAGTPRHRPRRRPGCGRLPGRRAGHARRPAAPGRPRSSARLDDRARRSTARGSAGSRSSSARPTPRRREQRRSSGLPTVSLDGVTAHELATQLGTVLQWQRGGRRLRARRFACRRRRPRPPRAALK